jgi:exonuclease III
MSPPSPPPPPLSPVSSSSSQLRVATFNIGLGFTRKFPEVLHRCRELALDIIGLQEIGDPPMQRSSHQQYLFIASPGPSAHEAGVGLLIAQELAPCCRAYKRSNTGRLVGVVLELIKGRRLLVASAYMPSGLDHSASPAKIDLARKVYHELGMWSRDVHQVILLGDLNETLTTHDRYPRMRAHPRAALHDRDSPIQALIDDQYLDAYRVLHSDASTSNGFTHFIDSLVGRCTRSRIDYIWTKGLTAASHQTIHIDSRLQKLSHHRLLWLTLQLDHPMPQPSSRPIITPTQPDLRNITKDERVQFGETVDQFLNARSDDLHALAQSSLTNFAHTLTAIVHEAATTSLPLMGGKPMQSKSILSLQRQRCDLTSLLRMAHLIHIERKSELHRSPEWVHLLTHCHKQHESRWSIDPRTII